MKRGYCLLEFSPELLKRLNEICSSQEEQYEFVNEVIKNHLKKNEEKS